MGCRLGGNTGSPKPFHGGGGGGISSLHHAALSTLGSNASGCVVVAFSAPPASSTLVVPSVGASDAFASNLPFPFHFSYVLFFLSSATIYLPPTKHDKHEPSLWTFGPVLVLTQTSANPNLSTFGPVQVLTLGEPELDQKNRSLQFRFGFRDFPKLD